VVLLDGYKGEGVLRVLRAGLVHVLKVNADELEELAEQCRERDAVLASAAIERPMPSHGRRFETVEAAAMAVHAGFGVRLVAVTDGAKAAYLFDFRPSVAVTISLQASGAVGELGAPPPSAAARAGPDALLSPTPTARRRPAVSPKHRSAAASRAATKQATAAAAPENAPGTGRGGCLFAAHAFRVPSVPYQADLRALQSPIGAGDACAGVFLHCLVRGVDPATAFAHGLAAASASCTSLSCAEFDTADLVAQVLPKLVIETWKEASVSTSETEE
jgi:fructose-1-phosphate kinase PfkB-like protein